jgi:DNA-directed RNA polymerase I, II, and III subunit RPABC2
VLHAILLGNLHKKIETIFRIKLFRNITRYNIRWTKKKKTFIEDSDSDEEEKDEEEDVDVDDDDDEIELSDDDDDIDLSDDDGEVKDKNKSKLIEFGDDNENENEEDEDDDELNENYLQKMEHDVKQNIIAEFHPELNTHSMEEVEAACTIIRDDHGTVIDPLHRTLPFVTRYEKARVIGERAKQINSGAKPFVEVEQSMIDGYLIALKEFEEKKIPFIIRRPLPDGTSEYWRLSDLEIIA